MRVKLGIILLLVVLFLVIFGWKIIRVWDMRSWYGVEPYRMLVIREEKGSEQKDFYLITIWPDSARVLSLEIPQTLRLMTVGGYGTYRIASLLDLGRVEKEGDRILRESVEFTFGVPIHQVYRQFGPRLDFNGARFHLLKQGMEGNQSVKEVMEIISLMNMISTNNIENIELSKHNAIKTVLDTDGTESVLVEPSLLDHFVIENMSAIWKEAALTQVAMINASGKPQMAALWSRFPRVSGFDVVSVTDQQAIENQTQILFSDETLKESLMGKVLQRMFSRADLKVANTANYRARIAIVIGLDSWKWLNDRNEYLKH